LSGGNIQKVVLARELSSKPRVLLVDQPSRGVDVGSMETVHGLIREQRDAGLAILLVSADLDEVLRLASRILVFYGGQITAEFQDVSNLQPSDLGPYMLGAKRQEATV
jgi:simple sugar transport system ATP-binding protein